MDWLAANYKRSLLQRESMVASALRPSLRACEAPAEEVAASGPAAACGVGADRSVVAVSADEFSVEDLLDIEALEGCAELGDDEATEPVSGAAEEKDKLCSDWYGSSSVVSCETMTLPVPQELVDIGLPVHDADELEWVSCVMDDSLTELQPQPKLLAAAMVAAPRRPLDGAAEALVRVKAKRSMRSRTCVWPLSGVARNSAWSSSSPPLLLPVPHSSHYSVQEHTMRPPKKDTMHGKRSSKSGGKPKKRCNKPTKQHRRPTQYADVGGAGAAALKAKHVDRRCSHCGVNKTPQWRAGPEGAKTLCNACGVRYTSGRLLPEYRPACSPTFVSTIHSNFHRKVVQMRRQKDQAPVPVTLPPPVAPVPPATALVPGAAATLF